MKVIRILGFGALMVSALSQASDKPFRVNIGHGQGTTLPISGTPPIGTANVGSPSTYGITFQVIGQTSWIQNGATVSVTARQIEDPSNNGQYKVTIAPNQITSFQWTPNPDRTNHADESSTDIILIFTEVNATNAGLRDVRVEVTLSITPSGNNSQPTVKKFNVDFKLQFHEKTRSQAGGIDGQPVPIIVPVPSIPAPPPPVDRKNIRRPLWVQDYYDYYVTDPFTD